MVGEISFETVPWREIAIPAVERTKLWYADSSILSANGLDFMAYMI